MKKKFAESNVALVYGQMNKLSGVRKYLSESPKDFKDAKKMHLTAYIDLGYLAQVLN